MAQEKAKNHNLKAVPSLTDATTPLVLDEESSECPKCFNSGLEVLPEGARPCSCRKLKSREKTLKSVRLPKHYGSVSFDSYKPRTQLQAAAKKWAANFATEYPAVNYGILLMGSVGVGKTHLAVAMLKKLSERGIPCMFYEFSSLLKKIQDSYNPTTQASELSVLSPVLNTPVLVLDELGSSKPTNWVLDTLALIINSRYNEDKFTICTTNYFDNRPTDREDTLEDRVGVRVRSRLHEMCRTIILDGTDYRKKIDQSLQRY